jgi:hypothetical protein
LFGRGGNALSLDDIGSVLEIEAKDYYHLSKEKLIKFRTALKKFEAQGESDAKTQAGRKKTLCNLTIGCHDNRWGLESL